MKLQKILLAWLLLFSVGLLSTHAISDKSGKEINRIYVEEHPISIAFGGKDGNTLFITTNSSLYSVRVK